ncbi:PucR family transcriptional regulator [Rathayibacter soli]|uniref:PucR family transcriptional regulator n=1 Tax=Rathayibacter soli TaxID=3144168 RepID=UPI0027E3B4F2|nr:PucR family transcriptional regulator ligand-binding domain-containing protein [Glaciibacter superstes]
MPLSLREVLLHPALAPGKPVLRAGFESAETAQVRWVHSSEVLDIAALLRGGEFLLTGGTNLISASANQQVDYVASLAKRKIAALAIETGPHLRTLPPEMIRAAQSAGLPLVELRKVVPFVDVAESINSVLVGESALRLQQADLISHAIAAELAEGHGLDQLLAVLAELTGTDVTLTGMMGNLLGAAVFGDRTANTAAQGIDIEVPIRGGVTGNLHIDVPAGTDAVMARVAGERVIDILSLSLLWQHPPTLQEAARAELFRAIAVRGARWRIPQLSAAAGLDSADPMIAIVIRALGATPQPFRPERILSRPNRTVLIHSDSNETLALVVLQHDIARTQRSQLVGDLTDAIAGHNHVASVGPLVAEMGEAPDSVTEARLALDIASLRHHNWAHSDAGSETRPTTFFAAGTVVDAESVAVERLAHRNIRAEVRASFVHALLSDLIENDRARDGQLLETLNRWLDYGCNASEAARALHIERQSMHNRLTRIFALIGGDPRGTGRLAGLHLATRLARTFQPLPSRAGPNT